MCFSCSIKILLFRLQMLNPTDCEIFTFSTICAFVFLFHAEASRYTNLVCLAPNSSVAAVDICQLKAVRRGVSEVNVRVHSVAPVQDANISLTVYKRTNGWTPVMPTVKANICSFLAKRQNNPLLNAFVALFSNYSNVNHECPYDYIHIQRMRAPDTMVLVPFPNGKYMLKVGISFMDTDPALLFKIVFEN